jgi:hypothetical protein
VTPGTFHKSQTLRIAAHSARHRHKVTPSGNRHPFGKKLWIIGGK